MPTYNTAIYYISLFFKPSNYDHKMFEGGGGMVGLEHVCVCVARNSH